MPEVLREDFVLEQLAYVRNYIVAADAADPSGGVPGVRRAGEAPPLALSDRDRERLVRDLDEAIASATAPSAGQRASVLGINFDPRVFVTRHPLINLIQTRLEQCLSRFADRVQDQTRAYGQMEPCSPAWVASWVSEQWTKLIHNKHSFPNRRVEVTLADNARVIVVGDWATGLDRALAVRDRMAEELAKGRGANVELHVVHLGDVYYSGWSQECKDRLLDPWPVPCDDTTVKSWALPGNHDMYSGGAGFFDTTLGDGRFAAQEGASFFALANAQWQILGLDTAYEDADLYGPQAGWLAERMAHTSAEAIVLSHHQLYSRHDTIPPAVGAKVAPALAVRPAFAWFWGHEHRCLVYRENLDPRVRFARCIGHGGVPAYPGAGASPDDVDYELLEPIEHGEEKWLRMGFAVLDIEPGGIHVRYIDEEGKLNYDEDLSR
jgi:hypothetical protein